MAQIPDMNGDGFKELVVGAPLEDDHQGAVYVFYGEDKTIKRQYRQVTEAGVKQREPDEAGRLNLNNNVTFSLSLSSASQQQGFLLVCNTSVKVCMASWMLMVTALSTSLWERWELL